MTRLRRLAATPCLNLTLGWQGYRYNVDRFTLHPSAKHAYTDRMPGWKCPVRPVRARDQLGTTMPTNVVKSTQLVTAHNQDTLTGGNDEPVIALVLETLHTPGSVSSS